MKNKDYWPAITLLIIVILALTYLIPQTLNEHRMENERLNNIEEQIKENKFIINKLENHIIEMEGDSNK